MDRTIKSTSGFPLSILFAMIVTVALFLSLPLLTQLKITSSAKPETQPVLISNIKPPPPPSLEKEETTQQTPAEKEFVRKETRINRVPQVITLPGAKAAVGTGVIAIDVAPLFDEIEINATPTFTSGEVDQPPGLLRSFPLQYPYIARRDNIEGWVMLKFVVNTEGQATDVTVVEAQPTGLFEEAALRAVQRYKFKPAIKDGEAVCCFIKQRLRFELD